MLNNKNVLLKSNFVVSNQRVIRIKFYRQLKKLENKKSILKLINVYYKIKKYRRLHKIKYCKELKYSIYFNFYKKLNIFRNFLYNKRKRSNYKLKIQQRKKKLKNVRVIKFKSLYYKSYLEKKKTAFFSPLFCFYSRKRKSKTSFKTNFLKFKNFFIKKGYAGKKEKDS